MKKILAIDDQVDNLTVYEAVLANYYPDFKIIKAESGQEGINKAIEEQPDVILLDIIMPGMDGYETCFRLKAHSQVQHIPIILITAIKTDASSRVKGLEIGADAFLAKPIDPAEFAAQIRVMLRIKAAEDELRAEKKDLEILVAERTNELMESEYRFKQVAENANEWIWEFDKNGLYTYSSQAIESLLGFTPDELVGKKHFYDLFDPSESVKLKKKAFEQISKKLNVNNFENLNIHKNGNRVLMQTSASPIIDKNGELLGYRGIDIDITIRKNQEVQIQESLSFNQSLLNTIPFGMDIVDMNGTVLFANPLMTNAFGNDIVGKRCWELYRHNKTQCEYCPLKGHIRIGETASIETDGIIDGKTFEITHTGMIYKGEEAIMEVFYDISGRKRNEKIQRIVFNIANAVNSSFDLDDLNQNIKNLLGELIDTSNYFIALYNKADSTIDVPFMVDEKDFFTNLPFETSLTGYVIRTQKPLLLKRGEDDELREQEELEAIGTAAEVWLGVPLKYQEKVIGAIVVQSYNDVNAYSVADLEILEYVSHQVGIAIERKKSEQELIAALEKAEESDRLKSAFLANVSHEIRTPLNSILGFSDLISDPDANETEKQGYLQMIDSGGNQLLSIIDDIVNISLIESGQLSTNISQVDLSKMLYRTYKSFSDINRSNNTKITLRNCPSIKVESDEGKIKQVLANLLTNAIKHTEEGEVILGYELKDKTIQFYVRDTGKGIPPGYEDKLFNRFFRIEDSNQFLPGTGLGLAICKAIVNVLGGVIWYESELGVGSTFYFTIPNSLSSVPK